MRCLEPVDLRSRWTLQELYDYPDPHQGATGRAGTGDGGRRARLHQLEDDLIDLEPVLRDAVVLALPLQPVCRDDCPGLCPECGARLADDPEHHHDSTDPRWAALSELTLSDRQDAADLRAPTQEES